MKQVVQSILPALKLLNWKVDAIANLRHKAWTFIEDNGEYVELVFRDKGELLVIKDGNAIDGNWKVIQEMRSLILDIGGNRKVFQTGWGNGPITVLQAHGLNRYCILVDTSWVQPQDVFEYLIFIAKKPELIHLKWDQLHYDDGFHIPLLGGDLLIVQRTNGYRKRGCWEPPNPAYINGEAVAQGLYLSSDLSRMFEIRDGELWTAFKAGPILNSNTGTKFTLFIDQLSEYRTEQGNPLIRVLSPHFEYAPDGRYKLDRFTSIKIKGGRVR